MEKEILKWAKENGKEINQSIYWEECYKISSKMFNFDIYAVGGRKCWGIPVYVLVDKNGNKKISTPKESMEILGLYKNKTSFCKNQ